MEDFALISSVFVRVKLIALLLKEGTLTFDIGFGSSFGFGSFALNNSLLVRVKLVALLLKEDTLIFYVGFGSSFEFGSFCAPINSVVVMRFCGLSILC